jgi:hypothetical protein
MSYTFVTRSRIRASSATNCFSNVELEDIIDDECNLPREADILLLVLSLFVYCTSNTIFVINNNVDHRHMTGVRIKSTRRSRALSVVLGLV